MGTWRFAALGSRSRVSVQGVPGAGNFFDFTHPTDYIIAAFCKLPTLP